MVTTKRIGEEIWGVLGGVGPLASAEFLTTIYDGSHEGCEQDLPVVLLFSDPTIPDRTEALLRGREAELVEEVTWRADRLLSAGATKLVLCCISLHPIVPLLPPAIRQKLISLVDVIVDSVGRSPKRHLMLCTKGTRSTRLFERHERWQHVCSRIVFPDDEDQRAVHAMIYEIKSHDTSASQLEFLSALMDRYGVQSCIAGCTEIHILAKRCQRTRHLHRQPLWIDPLAILASTIAGRSQDLRPADYSSPRASIV